MKSAARLTRKELVQGLRDAGIGGHEVVVIYADLTYLGPIAGVDTGDSYLRTVWEAVLEAASPVATIVTPTASTQLCNTGIDFVAESTFSISGVLANYAFKLPHAVRSAHPFVSYTACGPLAESIAMDTGLNGYGDRSPMSRMIGRRAGAVSIGLPVNRSCSVVHHAEHVVGVPYRYYKEFPNRVFARGKCFGDRYLFHVRRPDMDIEKDENEKVLARFASAGHRIETVILPSGARLHGYDLYSLYETSVALLCESPYALLRRPPGPKDEFPHCFSVAAAQ